MSRRGWTVTLVVVLGVSLMVNFFAVGALVATWQFQKNNPRAAAAASFRDRIPEHARPIFREAFSENRYRLRPAFEAMRDARRALADAVTAETYDPAAVDAAFAVVEQRATELQSLLREVLTGVIQELPDDVRQELRLGPGPRDMVDPLGLGPPPRPGDGHPPPPPQ